MNVNTDGLPQEMQQRIADIIEKAKQNVVTPATAESPHQAAIAQPQQIQRPPSLIDHTIALRQEVAALRNELHAVAQVVDAVGNATGQLYSAFFPQPEAPTYSSQFQEAPQQVDQDDY